MFKNRNKHKTIALENCYSTFKIYSHISNIIPLLEDGERLLATWTWNLKKKRNFGDDCALKVEALQGDMRLKARTGFTPPLIWKPQPPLNKPNPVPAPQKPHKPTPVQKYYQKGKGGRDQRKEKTDSSRASPNWSLSKQLKLLIP